MYVSSHSSSVYGSSTVFWALRFRDKIRHSPRLPWAHTILEGASKYRWPTMFSAEPMFSPGARKSCGAGDAQCCRAGLRRIHRGGEIWACFEKEWKGGSISDLRTPEWKQSRAEAKESIPPPVGINLPRTWVLYLVIRWTRFGFRLHATDLGLDLRPASLPP